MLLKISAGPVKLRDTQEKKISYMKKCRAAWCVSERAGVSGEGNFSTGNVSEQPLAWEANMAPLIAAGYGLPWRRLFLLALPQACLVSHP